MILQSISLNLFPPVYFYFSSRSQIRHKEHFCEILLNLDRCFWRRCRLKIFLELSQSFFKQSKTNCAILVEDIMRNTSVIFNEFGQAVQRCRLQTFLIQSSDDPFVQQGGNMCAILVDGIIRSKSLNFFNLDQWFRAILSRALATPLVYDRADPFVRFLVGGIIRRIIL